MSDVYRYLNQNALAIRVLRSCLKFLNQVPSYIKYGLGQGIKFRESD